MSVSFLSFQGVMSFHFMYSWGKLHRYKDLSTGDQLLNTLTLTRNKLEPQLFFPKGLKWGKMDYIKAVVGIFIIATIWSSWSWAAMTRRSLRSLKNVRRDFCGWMLNGCVAVTSGPNPLALRSSPLPSHWASACSGVYDWRKWEIAMFWFCSMYIH